MSYGEFSLEAVAVERLIGWGVVRGYGVSSVVE